MSLTELAQTGKRVSHPWLAMVMVLIFFVISQFVGLLNFFALRINQQYPQPAPGDENGMLKFITPQSAFEQVLFLVGIFGTMAGLLWLYVWLYERRDFFSTIGLAGTKRTAHQFLHGWLMGFAMFTVSVIALLAVDLIELKGAPFEFASLWTLPGWLIQGGAEEIIFRGFLMPLMILRWGTAWGIIVNSFMFAVMHGLNPGITLIAVLNLFLFGVVASLYTINENSLWGIGAAHAVWNWAQGNFYGFEVSGQRMAGGSIFSMVEVGPDYLTGGTFGPEGGLAITAILLLALAWQGHLFYHSKVAKKHY